jgi:hypothetical protein
VSTTELDNASVDEVDSFVKVTIINVTRRKALAPGMLLSGIESIAV